MIAKRALKIGVSAALVVLSLATAAPSLATTVVGATGDISNVQASTEEISLVFEVTNTEGVVAPGSVQLLLNGVELEAEARPADDNDVAKTLLLIDTSNSMNEPGRLESAKQAARTFVDIVPDYLEVGLVTFDKDARVVQAPTTDRAALTATIDELTAVGRTSIFDAVVLGAETLGDTGVRSMLLLTDGKDTVSANTLEAAVASLDGSAGIKLDIVAFQSKADPETLKQLADAGSGSVLAGATAEELTQLFQARAEAIKSRLLVTAAVPEGGPTGQVSLTVSGDAEGEFVSATGIALIDAPTAPPPAIDAAPTPSQLAPAPLLRPELIFVAVGLFFLGICAVLAYAFNAAVPGGKRSVSKRLSVYTLDRGRAKERKRESTAFGQSNVAQSAVDFAGRLTARRGLEERLQRRLDAGAVTFKAAEWILIQAATLLFLPLIVFFLSGRNFVLTIIAVALAIAGPPLFLSIKESMRLKKFSDTLPETLQLMAGSLSAGYSLPQACDSVVREGQDPVATEFNRALVETRLGVPIEDALETIADRMRSKDWAWVVMAIRVQREVGGNLAELLITVASTLRDRARIRRQIQTLSAEGRLSAWILGGLPIVFTLYLLVARPSYILTLTKEPLGWLMIAGGVIFMVIGGLWMKKIVDVEV
jgi:tight adherence protein B